MQEKILLGKGPEILEIPQATWKQHLTQIPEHIPSRLNFMTQAHHQIRYFVVKEMANRQSAIEPGYISEKLEMPLEQVQTILEELERKLFFLVRDEHGAVAWAYPVTVEKTPHQLSFASGERLYAA